MELEHSFTVPVPVDQAWNVLLDVERVAPCMPGATLEAAGKQTRGSGTAAATVRSELHGQDGQTEVTVHTSLNVTGRPAQFGRGVMADVSAKLPPQPQPKTR
jgi:carbon monoxide dehydrogenase subunit G